MAWVENGVAFQQRSLLLEETAVHLSYWQTTRLLINFVIHSLAGFIRQQHPSSQPTTEQ